MNVRPGCSSYGTIPVGLLGVLFEAPVRRLFGSTEIVAAFLIVNAGIMFAGEWLRGRERRHSGDRPLETLRPLDAVGVGVAQSLALFPGISRSGSSIVAGLLVGLSHEDAARYSFLLATPAIGAASLLEIPRLFAPAAHGVLLEALVGGVLAGITAYASVAFLTKYFQSNDLRPFGWYCSDPRGRFAHPRRYEGHRMKLLPLLVAIVCFILAIALLVAERAVRAPRQARHPLRGPRRCSRSSGCGSPREVRRR